MYPLNQIIVKKRKPHHRIIFSAICHWYCFWYSHFTLLHTISWKISKLGPMCWPVAACGNGCRQFSRIKMHSVRDNDVVLYYIGDGHFITAEKENKTKKSTFDLMFHFYLCMNVYFFCVSLLVCVSEWENWVEEKERKRDVFVPIMGILRMRTSKPSAECLFW